MAQYTSINLQLRLATPEDLSLLLHWEEQPHVTAAAPDADWDFETELFRRPPWREHLIAELAGRPIGFVQIIDPALEESHYWGAVPTGLRALDIWIGAAGDLGKGYGTLIMEAAIARCFATPDVGAILIDPLVTNEGARRFYARLGFVHQGNQVMQGDEVAVMKLERATWKQRA